ncbi:MAG: YgiQ family radical SAM protein [Paludibacteraceae bacterium]|nr:YgiQ family radical SAM protein [Paludibacteraceae bacterium]
MFLPTTAKEVAALGWDYLDVIIFTGDAYIDHPAFGAAVIARVLEAEGLKVAVVPQPNWRDDLRDFRKLGAPRMFFAVTAGAMDSMVNHYTAAKRLRSDDAYSIDGKSGFRPDRATDVYCHILKELYPSTPIVIGGIEASQRRFTHYDYWDDKLRESILVTSRADLLVCGMGEKPMRTLVRRLKSGDDFASIKDINQTAYLSDIQQVDIELAPHSKCLESKRAEAQNFKIFETESNKMAPTAQLGQRVGNKMVVCNPAFPPLTTEELDAIYDLPYTRQPHPRYKGKRIPAFDMIKYSITMHRGCFGGCSFCTISAHQGKHIVSRSKESILREVRQIVSDKDFKGYISDLGGPSANMYRLTGKNLEVCRKCSKPSCLHPAICSNLNRDHSPLIDLYRSVRKVEGVKKATIGSGIRYDLATPEYIEEVVRYHVSGRLKVAPEHTSNKVLNLMRKPAFENFIQFDSLFNELNTKFALREQLIPYFISSHPGCTDVDMAEMAVATKSLNFHLEQVQDFTPTPMTLSTEMYYTGLNPYTMEPVKCARTIEQKKAQRSFFFWYKPDEKRNIIRKLKEIGRADLIEKLYRINN